MMCLVTSWAMMVKRTFFSAERAASLLFLLPSWEQEVLVQQPLICKGAPAVRRGWSREQGFSESEAIE